MIYAILVDNRVIDITESEKKPIYPKTNDGIIPEAKICDESTQVGMFFDKETNTYSFNEPYVYIAKKPEEIIQESQLVIMEAIADQYEQGLSNRLDDQEVQATIFETILELGGNV